MKKSIIGGIIIILLIIGAVTIGNSSSRTDDPLRIGWIGPLSGGPALWGEVARNMAVLAVEDINAQGGINKRPLEVVFEDGKCNPQTAVSAAQKLLQSGVAFLIGGHCSPETQAIVPLTKDGNAFMIANLTATDNILDESNYAYRTSGAAYAIAENLVALTDPSIKTIAILNEESAFASSFADTVATLFKDRGISVVVHESYQPGESDFKTTLLKLAQHNPDALFISPQDVKSAAILMKHMEELDINPPIIGNSILIEDTIYENSGKASVMVGAYSVIPYVDETSAKAQEFTKRYEERFGVPIAYSFTLTSAVYDSVFLLRNALEQCGEDVECVRNYFTNVTYEGVAQSYKFKENGDNTFDSWAKVTISPEGKEVIEVLR